MHLNQSVNVLKNCKTKRYTDGTTNSIICRSAIFKDSFDLSLESIQNQDDKFRLASEHSQNIIDYLEAKGISYDEYDERRRQYHREHPRKPSEPTEPRNDSIKRAKDSIFDLVLNNDFEYFFTGTINPDNFDSTDSKILLKPVQKWLKNMVLRYGLSYIMIAERHKKGGIHFHGLFRSAVPLRLADSGTKLYKGRKRPVSDEKAILLGFDLSEGRTIYNLHSWFFGFTTCIKLVGDRMNTAFYVTKYITKDCKKIFGRFFWHSRDLKRPAVVVSDVDFDSVDSIECNGFKYQFERGSNNEKDGDSVDL